MADEPARGLADVVAASTAGRIAETPDHAGAQTERLSRRGSDATLPLRTPIAPTVRQASVRHRPAERAVARRRSRPAGLLGHACYLMVLAAVVAGLLRAWHGPHAVGSGAEILGGALLAAALARLVLSPRAAGLLVSRRRLLDVLTFATLGAGLVVIGLALPPS